MMRNVLIGAVISALLCTAAPAHAQLNGENLLGDMGVKSGSQAAPGWYLSNVYYRYRTDTIRDGHGNQVTFDPNQRGSQSINAVIPLVTYVSSKKIFGANYGAMAVIPFANGSLEAPAFGLSESPSAGASDAYFVPLQLGWRTSRADFTTAVGFFAPNGRYEADASDNLGKGMWSYELSAGTTVYLDGNRRWSAATTAYWETHSTKKDTGGSIGPLSLDGVRVGQLLTLEGGMGRSFFGGAAHVGAAYYAQWKVTSDDLGLPGESNLPKHRVFAIGPDVTIPIATRSRLVSLVNVRYLMETGAELKTEGSSFLVTATFPVPSIKIPVR